MIMKILNGFCFAGLMLASILTMACGITWDTGQVWYGQAIAICFILMSLVLACVAVLVLMWKR
jgi:hypothetical protein